MDGTDNQQNSPDQSGAASGAPPQEGPLKFDFTLRLGSREETSAQRSGRATGEPVQLHPIDWDALALSPDEPRSYQSDGDLGSIIVQLANQIAGPDEPSATGAKVSVAGSATLAPSRPTAAASGPSADRAASPVAPSRPASAPESAPDTAPDPAGSTIFDPARTASAGRSDDAGPTDVRDVTLADTTSEDAAGPVIALRFAPVAPLPTSPRPVTDAAPSSAASATPPAPETVLARPRGINPAAAAVAAAAASAMAATQEHGQVTGSEAAAPEIEVAADEVAAPEVAAFEVPGASTPEVHAPEVLEILEILETARAASLAPASPSVDVAAPVPSAAVVTAVVPAVVPAVAVPVVAVPEVAIDVPVPAAAVPAPAVPAPAVAESVVAAPVVAAPVVAAPVVAAPAAAAPPALTLAKIERKPNAERPPKPVDFHALLGQAGLFGPPAKRKKKRHPFRALFKLVLVLGVIGAGLYFGKVQVLDKRWDPDLKPIAEAVSSERDLGWKRAVKLEVLPADDYATKLGTNGLFLTDVELDFAAAEWRALGLAEGRIEAEMVGAAAMSARPVFYDAIDGRIYELDGIGDELREMALHEALTEALLDQHVAWSDTMVDPTIDRGEARGVRMMVAADAVSVARGVLNLDAADLAEIDEQIADLAEDNADTMLRSPQYAVALLTADSGASVLFDFADDVDARNELLEVRSDATVLDRSRELSFSPDELASTVTNTRGMLYWYHLLASRLSPAEAWDAALAWDGDEVLIDTVTGNGVCVTAQVSAVDDPGRVRLLDALTRWAAAAPVEAGTTITESGPEGIKVSSCDPGADADTVLTPSISAVGEADIEYTVIERADAVEEDQQACVVNAVRGFDVASVFLRGDVAEFDRAVANISGACQDPA